MKFTEVYSVYYLLDDFKMDKLFFQRVWRPSEKVNSTKQIVNCVVGCEESLYSQYSLTGPAMYSLLATLESACFVFFPRVQSYESQGF